MVALIPLNASEATSKRRKRTTAAERNRARRAINWRKRLGSGCLRHGNRRWRCFHPFPFATKNGVQFSTEEQKQTSKIHPGQKNDDRGEREISRIVAIVFRDIQLEQLRHDDPTGREKDG